MTEPRVLAATALPAKAPAGAWMRLLCDAYGRDVSSVEAPIDVWQQASIDRALADAADLFAAPTSPARWCVREVVIASSDVVSRGVNIFSNVTRLFAVRVPAGATVVVPCVWRGASGEAIKVTLSADTGGPVISISARAFQLPA